MDMTSDKRAHLAHTAVYGFAENAEIAQGLAKTLDLAYLPIELHRFPDGEVRVRAEAAAPSAIVVCSLRRPNENLIELLFAASALRDTGASVITLVATYLAYMRQDIAFHRGEAVSQKIVGRLLAGAYDRFVSVDPHLHRTLALGDVFLGKPALTLSAAQAISAHIEARALPQNVLLIGPDEESRAWVSAVAGPLRCAWTAATKRRLGDRSVSIELAVDVVVAGRPVIIVDDMISSGGTLRTLAGLLRERNAASIEAYTTHALLSREDEEGLKGAGVSALFSCNSVPHTTNAIDLIPTLANGLRQWRLQ